MAFVRRAAKYLGIALLALLCLVGAALLATQTGWFKSYVRTVIVKQAANYLNGTLTVQHLRGNLLTGVELDGVALYHEGEDAVQVDKLTLAYDPITLARQGLVLKSLVLESPSVLLKRDERGWNFNRFVKTRKNTGGKGAPPITIRALNVINGHVVVNDGGRVVENVTSLNATLRFAYEKPGLEFDIARLNGRSPDINVNSLAGNVRFESGATSVANLAVVTDRSDLHTDFAWSGGTGPFVDRSFDVRLQAARLSLPEVALIFKPLSGINLSPAVDVNAHGTFGALNMNVAVRSTAGNASGTLVGHFLGARPGLEGTLDAQQVNLRDIVNRKEWETRVTGRARFNWVFGHPLATGAGRPMHVSFNFEGSDVEGFGYGAQNVKAQGAYDAPDLRFTANGAAYGAAASTRASFHFPASGPMSYTLAGNFSRLDMRRLPRSLAMPKLATNAGGQYQFSSDGRNWRGSGTLAESKVEGATFGSGTVFAIDSTNRALHYSAAGTVVGLNPQRFAAPFQMEWLADDRLRGLLTGSFSFEGSGRTTDQLVLNTTADLTNSTMAGARFPAAHVTMQMGDRVLSSTFDGSFEQLPGSLLTDRKELADSTLNGSANASVTVAIPAIEPATLRAFNGTATLTPSTIAGIAVEKGALDASYDGSTATVRALSLTGPSIEATASGTLAVGDTGNSNLQYDIAATDLGPIGRRFGEQFAGGAHIVGKATGPGDQLTFSGTFDANRFKYGASVDALTASSTYTILVPHLDASQAKIDADTKATFLTIAGQNIPQASAKISYANQELTFDSTFEQPQRSLGVAGRMLLHPDHNEVHLRALNLSVGTTQWALPAGQEATARYSPTAITIDNFALERGAERISAKGTVAIGDASSHTPNDLTVGMENVQVRDVNQIMLGTRTLDGLINATAEIRGTRSDPRVQADFSVTNGSVQGVTFDSFAGKATYSAKAADIDVRLQENANAYLTAKGIVPIANGPGDRARTSAIDVAVKSSPIDIALFQPATTQLTNLSGQMDADLRIAGTLESPKFDGRLNLTNAGFTVTQTSVPYSQGLARLTFEGDRMSVERFEVADNDGDKLVAIGNLGLVGRTLGAMNVQVSSHQFKVLDNTLGHVELDADLRVTGDASKPQITGTLSSQNARLEVDQLLEQLTTSAYSTEATVATTPDAPPPPAVQKPAAAPAVLTSLGLYKAATVDVHVKLPDDLVLRGRDMQTSYSRIGLGNMNIIVGGDINMRKAPGADAEFIGTVSVVRGFYEFQNRRFDVLRDSEIRFLGNVPIDPALQVGAEREISGVTAVVNIRGTARQPIVTLSSNPPMDQADVLSLIVFNQPINQLGEAERVNLAQRAGSMAAGYIATPLANSIADALDLDLFEIRPEGGINGQPSVALGQQFGSRLFVQFKQDFGSEDRSELSLEYRISELLRLVSTVSQGAQQTHRTQRVDTTGTDLIFVLSY